jgi:hypothetical protein
MQGGFGVLTEKHVGIASQDLTNESVENIFVI